MYAITLRHCPLSDWDHRRQFSDHRACEAAPLNARIASQCGHAVTITLSHLPPNMRQPLLAVEAHGLSTAVSEHLRDLSVLLPVLTENELALVVIVLVLSTSPVLTTLQIEIIKTHFT